MPLLNPQQLELRIIDLESRIAFMQVTLDELNLIVTKQQDQITELTTRLRDLTLQARENLVEKESPAKPPHY